MPLDRHHKLHKRQSSQTRNLAYQPAPQLTSSVLHPTTCLRTSSRLQAPTMNGLFSKDRLSSSDLCLNCLHIRLLATLMVEYVLGIPAASMATTGARTGLTMLLLTLALAVVKNHRVGITSLWLAPLHHFGSHRCSRAERTASLTSLTCKTPWHPSGSPRFRT
jgi:hypothetical protein